MHFVRGETWILGAEPPKHVSVAAAKTEHPLGSPILLGQASFHLSVARICPAKTAHRAPAGWGSFGCGIIQAGQGQVRFADFRTRACKAVQGNAACELTPWPVHGTELPNGAFAARKRPPLIAVGRLGAGEGGIIQPLAEIVGARAARPQDLDFRRSNAAGELEALSASLRSCDGARQTRRLRTAAAATVLPAGLAFGFTDHCGTNALCSRFVLVYGAPKSKQNLAPIKAPILRCRAQSPGHSAEAGTEARHDNREEVRATRASRALACMRILEDGPIGAGSFINWLG
jgi:hypothetical protein